MGNVGTVHVGVLVGDLVHDIDAVRPSLTMRGLLMEGAEGIGALTASAMQTPGVPCEAVQLLAPITNPEKVICIGMNYVDHCTEQNLPLPEEPVIFSKFASAICGPGAPILLASEVTKLDWEVELVIVIGKGGRRIPKESAMQHVAGYTVAHDVSARDWQFEKNNGQWLIGKSMDGYCPMGPAIVTPDELSDPHNLGLRCRVNGVIMQDSNTNQLVHKTESIIAWCSKYFTLSIGDVILTGTPPGVGCFRKPPVFLKAGDVVEVEIDEIGKIQNTVVAESV